jgi:Domain of Unknown Function (DUF748)
VGDGGHERAARARRFAWPPWASRRRVAVGLVVLLLLGVRAWLPSWLRTEIESQAGANLTGTLHVGDVDLWLVRGAIALEDVQFRLDGDREEAPPFAAWSRLYVNLSWLSLLGGTVRLQTVEIDDPVLALDRTRAGEVPLPGLREPTQAEPEEEGGEAWGVVVDRAFLRHGSVRLVDHVPEPAEELRLGLDGVELAGFSLEADPKREPGRVSVVAHFGDGALRLTTTIESESAGFGLDAELVAEAVPLDRLQVHAPELGWQSFVGRLDADVRLQLPPGGLPTAQGTVALRDVAVRVAGEDDPVLSWGRIEAEADQVDVAARTVSLARVEIDGPRVEWVRGADGVVFLPLVHAMTALAETAPDAAAPTPAAVEPEAVATPTPVSAGPEPAPTGPAADEFPWDFYVARATLTDGRIRLIDRLVDPPETLDLGIEGLSIAGFALERSPDREPGKASIEARFGDGTLGIEIAIEPRSGMPYLDARLEASNVPLEELRVHVPSLGWSGFRGRLDSDVEVVVAPGAAPRASGRVTVRDLAVDVPAEPEPVLSWRRLEVDAETIDPAARRAALERVFLDGAQIVVRPGESVPLPLFPSLVVGAGDGAPGDGAPGVSTPPEPVDSPWDWSVRTIEISESVAHVTLPGSPLDISIPRFRVSGASADLGSPVEIDGAVTSGAGTVAVRGTVTPEPLAAKLAVELDELALGPLADAVGGVPVAISSGVASGNLTVELAGGGIKAGGAVAVGDLAVLPRDGDGKEFALGWKRLEVDLRELAIPPPSAATGGQAAPASPSSGPVKADTATRIQVYLDSVRLTAPSVLLTRTDEGIVLPAAPDEPAAGPEPSPAATAAGSRSGAEAAQPSPAKPAPTPSPNAATPAAPPESSPAPAAPAESGPSVALRVRRLTVRDGTLAIVDRTVRPFFRGKLTRIDLDASGLEVPGPKLARVSLDVRLPGEAPLAIRGSRVGDGLELDAVLSDLPLQQLNPYLSQAAGYTVASGQASITSNAWLGPTWYESWSDLSLADFDLQGAAGDTLFADQFGVPLSLAISLMRGPTGGISLGIPISGGRGGGTQVDLGPVIGQALVKVMLGALTSPLKLIGAVVMGGDRIQAVAPAPIGFDAGRAVIADDAWWRVDELANALASYPGLAVTLRGGSGGAADVRGLQEAAVLADLQQDQGFFGALATLGSRGDRNAVREYLEERAAKKPAELEESRRPALDEWAAAKVVSEEDLSALAIARAERLRETLEKDYGVAASRLVLGEPVVSREGGRPEVAIALGGR